MIYIIERSKGVDIQIEESELMKVLQAIKTGKIVIVKQGLINPKYISGIVKDKKSMEVFSEIELENIFDGKKISLMLDKIKLLK